MAGCSSSGWRQTKTTDGYQLVTRGHCWSIDQIGSPAPDRIGSTTCVDATSSSVVVNPPITAADGKLIVGGWAHSAATVTVTLNAQQVQAPVTHGWFLVTAPKGQHWLVVSKDAHGNEIGRTNGDLNALAPPSVTP